MDRLIGGKGPNPAQRVHAQTQAIGAKIRQAKGARRQLTANTSQSPPVPALPPSASTTAPDPPSSSPTYFTHDNKTYVVTGTDGVTVHVLELDRTNKVWKETTTVYTQAEVESFPKVTCPPMTGGARKSRRLRRHSKKHRKTRRA